MKCHMGKATMKDIKEVEIYSILIVVVIKFWSYR
jgi:hypothetical protein